MKESLLYENKFNKSPDKWALEMEADWGLEGKGIIEAQGDHISMRSTMFTVPRDPDGHFNFWLKKEFSANVAFEFEFRYAEPGDQGLAIIMWAAKGRNGEFLFDPALPIRKGEEMADMHSGAINCYHTSYIARGRKTANLRKNYGFHKIIDGPDLSTCSQPDEWHTIRLEHFDNTITLLMDGNAAYSWTDDGTIGGPPHDMGGMFGFRQQNNLCKGDYRNFKVFELSVD